MSKNIKIVLIILVIILLGLLVLYYYKTPKNLTPPIIKQADKIKEISQSLTTQEQTPQFKAKLEEMSKSLNKK